MRAGARLAHLAGRSGPAAGLLLSIGTGGATAGAALAAYSGLAIGTAAAHLLAERHAVPPAPTFGGGESAAHRERLFREHHEYLDGLREIHVQIADDVRGARTISISTNMQVPDDVLPPAMRGKVTPVRIFDVMDNPLILATMALLIDEADD